MGAVNSISGSWCRSIFVLYLLRSSPSLAAVPSISYLRSWAGPTLDHDPTPDPYLVLGAELLIYHTFYFSVAILIVLNDNLELTFRYRLRDFFKYEIDMCSYSLLLVNSIFGCELHFFNFFLYVCKINVAEVLIIYFCNYYHVRFYHHMSTKVKSIFGWSTPSLAPAVDPY